MYKCFTEKGESLLPSETELKELQLDDKRPLIFIDTNVCLHIARYIDHKKNAKDIDKNKIWKLKKYIDKNEVELSPFLALYELSYKDIKFDESKFWDFNDRISFFKLSPYKNLRNYNFDFNLNFIPDKKPDLDVFRNVFIFEPFYYLSYCCLLKIREISLRNSLSKDNADKNFYEFQDWMINELDIQLGIETRLALNIFGGFTQFRKMVWIDGKIDILKKKLIGTVWDIIHARFCTNNYLLSKLLEENLHVYFLTNDTNLTMLMNDMELAGLLDFGRGGATSIIFSESNHPNFSKKFVQELKNKSINITAERALENIVFNKEKTINLINDLEKKNNIT